MARNVEKSRFQKEFEALPEWAQKMVRAVGGYAGYGFGTPRLPVTDSNKYNEFHLVLLNEKTNEWLDGFRELCSLAAALTAPWPPPTPTPHQEMTTNNIVEMIADGDDDCAFDQPCHFGHRVECHAVYCHNDGWPDSPRKCRRNRTDYLHEDCPGFVPNTLYKEKH